MNPPPQTSRLLHHHPFSPPCLLLPSSDEGFAPLELWTPSTALCSGCLSFTNQYSFEMKASSAASPSHSPYAYISPFPKGNCSKPYLAINILLYLSPSLHLKKHFTLGSLLPHLLLLPRLCCLASTPLHTERSLTKVTSIAKSSGSL